MNNFILSYSTFSAIPTHNQLLNHMQTSRYIDQYYQPYVGTFFLKSDTSPHALNMSLKGLFDTATYTLAFFNPEFAGGSLPQDVWDWLNHGVIPVTPAPPPPKAVILGQTLAAMFGDDGSAKP